MVSFMHDPLFSFLLWLFNIIDFFLRSLFKLVSTVSLYINISNTISLCDLFLCFLFSVSLFPCPFAHCHVLWERHQVVHDQKKFTYTSKQADWQTDSTVNARVHPLNRGPQHRELSKTKHQTGQRGGGGGRKYFVRTPNAGIDCQKN